MSDDGVSSSEVFPVPGAGSTDAELDITKLFQIGDVRQPNTSFTERYVLFAILAFESDLLDLPQFTAACRGWAADKSQPLADLLLKRGWINADDRDFLQKQLERKLAL